MLIKTVADRDGRFYVTITHSFVLIESGTAEPHMKLLKNFSISSENKPLILNSVYADKFWQSGETSILEAFGRHRDVHSEKKTFYRRIYCAGSLTRWNLFIYVFISHPIPKHNQRAMRRKGDKLGRMNYQWSER